MKRLTSISLKILITFFTMTSHAQTCLNETELNQLKAAEVAYLNARNVPTMTHALQDDLFKILVTQDSDASNCNVTITYLLPETDITQANQVLDTNPGKRIMLAGQGYQLPESKQISASAKIKSSNVKQSEARDSDLAIAHDDTLQSAPLGRNRASVELMYATLAQSRAIVMANALDSQPWSTDLIKQQHDTCKTTYSAEIPIAEACDCRTQSLSERISPRQLSYIQYLASDPYSSATGALASYNSLSEQINFSCKLKRR